MGARRRERSSTAKFSADERGRRQGECIGVQRWGLNDFAEEGGDARADSEGHVTGAEKPAAGDKRAGGGRVDESLEKQEMEGGSTE